MLAHNPSWDDQWRQLRERTYNWRIDINARSARMRSMQAAGWTRCAPTVSVPAAGLPGSHRTSRVAMRVDGSA